MLRGTYFTRLRADGGETGTWVLGRKRRGWFGVKGGPGRPAQKQREGPFLQGSQVQKKREGAGAPLTLVLLSSDLPPPQCPLNKICENATICSGDFLSQGWTCSGPLKIWCLQAWSTKANGGALGSQDRKDGVLQLQSPTS